MRGAQLGLLVVAILVAVIIGFIFSVLEAWKSLWKIGIRCCGNQKCYNTVKDVRCVRRCIDYTLKIINFICLLFAVYNSYKTKDFFSDLAGRNCSDANYSAMIKDFSSQVDSFVYARNRNSLLSFFVAVLADIAKLVYRKFFKGKKKDDKQKKNKVTPVNAQKPV